METSIAQGDDQGSCFPKCLGFRMSIDVNGGFLWFDLKC